MKEFKKIETICEKNRIINIFVLIPPKEFIYEKRGSEGQWEAFCALLKENKVNYLDLTPVLQNAVRQGQEPFFTVDPHLNKIGHSLVAQEIYRVLYGNKIKFFSS